MLRKALRSSFGTQAEIDRWLARERETVPANRLSDWRRFERSCHPVSREAFDREEREREISKLIAATESRVRLELTAELLAASFALGDNSEATWGEATVEQHQQRLDMLIKHAAGTVDTATRHRAAIAMIQAAGATCLAEVAS